MDTTGHLTQSVWICGPGVPIILSIHGAEALGRGPAEALLCLSVGWRQASLLRQVKKSLGCLSRESFPGSAATSYISWARLGQRKERNMTGDSQATRHLAPRGGQTGPESALCFTGSSMVPWQGFPLKDVCWHSLLCIRLKVQHRKKIILLLCSGLDLWPWDCVGAHTFCASNNCCSGVCPCLQ